MTIDDRPFVWVGTEKMYLWRAPDAPCPLCKQMTPSDAVSEEAARQAGVVRMTYTCRTCERLFIVEQRVS